MDEIIHYKTEVSQKLQKEMGNLAILQESLSRSDKMTENMLGILNTFERRLTKLEETIMPIYQETGNLQRRHENIEKTILALDHVIGYYHVAEEVEPTVRDGPSSNISNYIRCMDRLHKAMQYLTSNSPGSPEMSQVTALYDAGKEAMEKEFRSLLNRHGKPIPSIALLNLLASEEDGCEADNEPLEQLPENVLTDLKTVSHWLLNCDYETDFMQAYAAIRSSLLTKSLNNLKDHVKSLSGKDTFGHSPALKQKFRETPGKKKSLSFVNRASSVLKKQSNALEPPGMNRQSVSSLLKDEGCDVDINFYITAIPALLKLIQSEAGLMQDIIPEKHQRRIFDQLVQGGLDLVVKEGEQISVYIKKSTTRHNASPVIHLLPVLRQLRNYKPDFDISLEGCQAPTRTKLPSLISMLDATGAKALEDFVDNIRNDPDRQSSMPKDGTVHELTSNTMLFLEQLLEFSDTAGAMLLTQDPTSLPNVQNLDRPRLKLAEFMTIFSREPPRDLSNRRLYEHGITKVLSSLGLNLNNKAEAYNDAAIRSIFMLNNYNYILVSLRRSGMLDVIHLWNNEVEAFYEDQVLNQKRLYSQRASLLPVIEMRMPEVESCYLDLINQQKSNYIQSWSRVLHYISENQRPMSVVGTSPDAKIKEKDRNAIKEKFTGFNKELEEIYRVQKAFAIPDQELRSTLKEDNRNYIMPYYSGFLKRYRATNFTKNPDKYIKYSEADLVKYIDGFFDAAA